MIGDTCFNELLPHELLSRVLPLIVGFSVFLSQEFAAVLPHILGLSVCIWVGHASADVDV